MKIVVVSDLHFDRHTIGVPRFNEVESSLEQAAHYAAEIKAGAFLCLGDICDPDSGGATLHAMQAVIQCALKLSDDHGIPSFWIAGNHDVEDDGSGATTLTPLVALTPFDENINVAERPGWFQLTDKLALVCLPYVAVSEAYDTEEEAARMMVEVGNAHLRAIVAGHLMIQGVVLGEETTDMPRGRDLVFPGKQTTNALMRLNGHFHKRQVFDPKDGGPPIIIPGAPARFAFGHDEANEPAFLVLDVEG